MPIVSARVRLAACGLSFLGTGLFGGQGKEAELIRFWSQPGVTRVVVETGTEVRYKYDRLHNPERLFFDLPETRAAHSRRKFQTLAVHDKRVKQIRLAETHPGTLRVVFDLQTDVEFKASQLTNPDRLIVELRPAGASGGADMPLEPKLPAEPLVSSLARRIFQPPPDAAPALSSPPVAVKPIPELVLGRGLVRDLPTSRFAMNFPGAPRRPRVRMPDIAAATESTSVQSQIAANLAMNTTISSRDTAGLPAKRTTTGDQSLIRALGLKLNRVVLDAGHGGHDQGSSGPTGLMEKDLVLDVTRRLGALIEQRMGSEVIYTRTDDVYVSLESRTDLANSRKADLFLSIHANSSPLKTATGVETYYLNFTSARDALDVAARENASSQKSIFELRDLLQKIALKEKIEESKEFAANVQSALVGPGPTTRTVNRSSRDRGVRKAPFVVLIGAKMPSVLAEIGFVSNPRDEAQMKRLETRQKIAEALYKGVAAYANSLSRFQLAQQVGE